MTATPLPPLPNLRGGIVKHTILGELYDRLQVEQRMVAYATQARADLEAENKRLREALATLQMQCNSLAASNWREWQELSSPQEFERWAKSRAVHMEALARAALESKP